MINDVDQEFMELAIAEAERSVPEDGKTRPKVGAVAVRDGVLLASAFRGELSQGEHAEFTLLERKLKDVDLSGATVYATLEPCTTRNHPKIPCARRLVERRVKRVVIGQLDPNPQIRGGGVLTLREAQVEVAFFPHGLMSQLEDLNRHFMREHRRVGSPIPEIDDAYLELARKRPLDEWFRRVNITYWNRNFPRQASELMMHLVEVVGGLSSIASDKHKAGVDPQAHVAKALAWWLALCGKLGVKSVEAMLWDKFPDACAYCHKCPHDPDVCSEMKEASNGVRWEVLEGLGSRSERPGQLGDWQKMFSRIYPAQQTEAFGPSFARLNEEMGELAESVRVFNAVPGYFLSEASDVFAWLMHIQNILDSKNGVRSENRGTNLEVAFSRAYPDGCRDCGQEICSCPPILNSTIGRIAHEVPKRRSGYGDTGRFMTTEESSRTFRAAS